MYQRSLRTIVTSTKDVFIKNFLSVFKDLHEDYSQNVGVSTEDSTTDSIVTPSSKLPDREL